MLLGCWTSLRQGRQPIEDLGHRFVPAEGGDDVDPRDLGGDRLQELPGQGNALFLASAPGGAHPLLYVFGDHDAGDLVVEELRVAGAAQGEQAHEQWDGEFPQPLVAALDGLGVEDGLAKDEVGTGVQLAFQAAELPVEIGGTHIEGAPDEERGCLLDGTARKVHAGVRPVNQ